MRIIAELKARIDQLCTGLASERRGHDFTREVLKAESKALVGERRALEAANKRIGVLEAADSRTPAERQKADREHDRTILAEDRLKYRAEAGMSSVAMAPDGEKASEPRKAGGRFKRGHKDQITLTIDEDLLDRVDVTAGRMGVSRAVLVSISLGQTLGNGLTLGKDGP